MDFDADFFALFHLPRQFNLDGADLEARYREVQAHIHPDRFAHAGEAERRRSLQWATRANEAYQTLKQPLARAQYLLQLLGHALQADTNTVMDPEFLMEQMEWREAVQEAREAGSVDELDDLHHRLRQAINARFEELGTLFATALNPAPEVASAAEAAIAGAAELTRRLMFLDRLRHEIDDALADLDA